MGVVAQLLGHQSIWLDHSKRMAQRDPSKIKLAVLGELNAGKTQLVNRFMNGRFDSRSEPTIGFNMQSLGALEIWDLAGNRQ